MVIAKKTRIPTSRPARLPGLLVVLMLLMGLAGTAVAKLTDGYPAGKKIHMVGGGNLLKQHLGFILNIQEEPEDRLVLQGKFLDVYPMYLEKSQAGDLDATHNLGLMYLRGLGVKKDIQKAIAYLEKSSAKDANYATAQIFLDKALKEQASAAPSASSAVVASPPAQAVAQEAVPPRAEARVAQSAVRPQAVVAQGSGSLSENPSSKVSISAGMLVAWMLLVAGLGGYIWKRRGEKLAAHTAIPPAPLRGWLLFFIVGLGILAPGLTLGNLAGEFRRAELSSPVLSQLADWQNFKMAIFLTAGAFLAFNIYAALHMRFHRVPASVTLAKFAILSVPIASAVMGFVLPSLLLPGPNSSPDAKFLTSWLSTVIMAVVWLSYLFRSKQVRDTYSPYFPPRAIATPARPEPPKAVPSVWTPTSAPRTPEPALARALPTEDELYEKIGQELDSGNVHKPTWLKSFVHANGEENAAKAKYIELRLQALQA